MRKHLFVIALGVLAVAPPAASAAVTRTAITVPAANPAYVVENLNAVTRLAVSGTSNGGAAPIDLRCDAATSTLLVSGIVPVNGHWTATLTAKQLSLIDGTSCFLHAVPAKKASTNRTAFAGIQLSVSKFRDARTGTALYDFSATVAQTLGRGVYSSAGRCGVSGTAVFAPISYRASTDAFTCAAALPANIGGRSALRIDGENAYTARAAFTLFRRALAGFVPLSYSLTLDPVTGNTTVRDIETIVRCAPTASTFPATATSCTSLVSTGVRLDRTIVQDHDGRVSTVYDTYSSLDGKSHRIDPAYVNSVAGATPAWEFPWIGPTFTVYSPGFEVPLPPSAPISFFERAGASVPDSPARAIGAITLQRRPISMSMKSSDSVFTEYNRTITKTAPSTIVMAYSRATASADVAALASGEQTALTPPPCVVPRVLGKTLAQAKAALAVANCSVGRIKRVYSKAPRSGRVKSQGQRKGTTLQNGYGIKLELSRGPRPRRHHR